MHIGLEDAQDLTEDLTRGFDALRAAERAEAACSALQAVTA
jgi:hypothetical protein